MAGRYRDLNCRRWFPALFKVEHPVVWVSPVDRARIQATECPVSQTTGATHRWIRLYSIAQACKSKPVAGPVSAWPNRTAEAFEIMHNAESQLMGWERREAMKNAERDRKLAEKTDKFGRV